MYIFRHTAIAHLLNYTMCVCVCVHTHAQLSPTVCDPMDCSQPGSSLHGIFQARKLEWIAISFSRGSPRSRDRTYISCTGRWILYHWATGKPSLSLTGCYRLNVYVATKSIFWSPKPQCDGIWKWSLWEVIRCRWGHEGGAPSWWD